LSDEINNGNGVESAATIVGDVGELAVFGGDDFVRVRPGRNFSDDLQGGGIDDRKGLIAFAKDKQGSLWCFGGATDNGGNRQHGQSNSSVKDHVRSVLTAEFRSGAEFAPPCLRIQG
jgi:hypothetical protein